MLKRRNDARVFDFSRRAVGYWMEVDGETPVRVVRVFVTHEALSSIDPSHVRDMHGALNTFDANREQIDRAANSKFADGKFEDNLHERQRVIILRDMDL